ncbi:MAG: glycosyltransferase family 39 protein [Anaerolineae bacterium]
MKRQEQTYGDTGRLSTVLLLLIILLSFATHTYRLDAKSMWIEEGLSIYRAQLDLPRILSNVTIIQDVATHDTHPPLYFILLHFLIGVAGDSEFTFRFLSVAWAVLLVPLLYAFATGLLGRRAGLWSAAIAALSPVYLWYSQETRSYTMLVFLTAFSSYALLRLWQSTHRGEREPEQVILWVIAYLLSTIAAIFTHYGALFIVVFHWVVVLSLAVWQRRWWLIGLSAAASVFTLPLVPFVASRMQTGPERGFRFVPLFIMARDLWNGFSMGIAVRLDDVILLDVLFLLVFLLGLAAVGLGHSKTGLGRLLYLLGYLLIPTLTLYLLSHVKPMYEGVRHLLIVSPAYYLALGAGLDALSRRFRYLTITVTLLLVAGVAYSTHNTFFEPGYAKDDLRSAAQYIRAHLEPGELLVMSEPILWPVWEYYYGPDLPWTALPTYPHVAGEETIGQMATLSREYQGIWFAYGPTGAPRDNKGLVKAWFDEHLFQINNLDFHSVNNIIAMAHYLTRPPLLDQAPPIEPRVDVHFGQQLLLLGHDGLLDQIEPGEELTLTLYWQVLNRPTEDYSFSLLLVDGDGTRWSQTDIIPFNGFYPTSHWLPHTIVAQPLSIPVPYGCPPGQYRWEFRLYSPLTWREMEALDAAGGPLGTAVPLGTVEVAATPATLVLDMPIQHRRQEEFGGVVRLMGYDLAEREWRPGETLHLDLYWAQLVESSEDYRVVLRLADELGGVLREWVYALVGGPAGTVVRQQYDLVIPAQASAQRCSVLIEVQGASTDTSLAAGPRLWPFKTRRLALGHILVAEETRVFERPPIQHRLEARLGEHVEFLGYDLESRLVEAGGTIDLVLYWRALQETQLSYTVFIHLLDDEGEIRAQGDGLPCAGTRLTSGWMQREVILDAHEVSLGEDVAPGRYSLIWGMYDARTGARLPVFDGEGRPLGDTIEGIQIEVVP